MERFEDHSMVTDADEINYFLNNAVSADAEEKAAAAAEEKRLEVIADDDTKAHSDTLTIIIIAFVILLFGSVFTALTNHQDMTEDTDTAAVKFGKFVEGSYLSDIEKKFNEQLPLQDEFHNASVLIKYCFGIDNSVEDLIDIESKKLADDPYSISQTNEYIPVQNDKSSSEEDDDGREVTKKTLPEVVTTSNNKNKKISGITMTTIINEDQMNSETFTSMSVDRTPPPGNHEGGFDPYANVTQATQPTETQAPETQPADQQTQNNFIGDPNRSQTQPSETEPAETEPEQTGEETQEPQETEPTETAPPVTTTNNFLIPAQGR